MSANSSPLRCLGLLAITVSAGLMVASCAPQYSEPRQVQSSSPHVTYKYNGDQELVQANQSASSFCSQYQSIPRTSNLTNDPDGSKVVVFECVKSTMPVMVPAQYNPNVSYIYLSDQELLDDSRNAQAYCLSTGSQQVTSNTSVNANGTKTVSFQCSSTTTVILR